MRTEEEQLELKIDQVCTLLGFVDKEKYRDAIKYHLAFHTVKETCRIMIVELGLPPDVIEWRCSLL